MQIKFYVDNVYKTYKSFGASEYPFHVKMTAHEKYHPQTAFTGVKAICAEPS
jgi:hypothetical protein